MEYGNMLNSEDKILTKTCRNLKDFLPEDSSMNTLTKIEKMNIGRLSVTVAQLHATSSIERTAGIRRPRPLRTADTIATTEYTNKVNW